MNALSSYNPERSFGYVLYETARLLSKRFDQLAREIGLTRAQCQVLSRLALNEGINQSGLAELLELEPISLARCLDRMEQSGWVERRPDPDDRRARLLYMTEKARPLFDSVVALALRVRAEALVGLGEEEREHLLDMLQHVRTNLIARAPAPLADRAPVAAEAK